MPRQADLIFAKIVILNNLLPEQKVREALAELEKLEAAGQSISLDQLLERKNCFSPEQLQRLRAARDLHLLILEDRQYGQLCVQQGFTTVEQVKECLALQKQNKYKQRLYQILIQKGYLTNNQHNQILVLLKPSGFSLSAENSAIEDPFGKAVLEQNLATRAQVEECLKIQKRLKSMGIEKDLSAVMLDKRYLSPQQVQRLLSQLGKGQASAQAMQMVAVSTPPASAKSSPTPPQKTASASTIEGYEILAKLGQGAMGVIYKARHIKMNRIVALKVLLPEFAQDPQFRERFLREAKATTILRHPNIVQGYHAGVSNGFYYYAMEYVEGVTVKQLIRKKKRLEEKEAIRIVVQICHALEHAQEHGIVHRDIKPDNIMITKDGIAKLCDLGIAKEIDQEGSLTQTGMALGTPYYISPEQAMGEKRIDTRSDIYSLGATFFHMVTGRVPYEGDTSAVIMTKHISEPPPDAQEVCPSVSQEVATVIRKMMAKEPAYRYQTPSEVISDLEQILRGETLGLESSSSIFVQNGVKIPTAPVTRLSQIQQAPKGLRSARKSLVTTQPSGIRRNLRRSLVTAAATGAEATSRSTARSRSGMNPMYILAGIVTLLILLILVLLVFIIQGW